MTNRPRDLLAIFTLLWKEEWAELGPSDPSYHHYEASNEKLDAVVSTADIDRHLWLLSPDTYMQCATPPAQTGFLKSSDAIRFIPLVLKLMQLKIKSKIAKQSNDELFKGFMANGITSASPQADVPYYKEHHDNLIIKRFNLLTSTAIKLHAMTSKNEKLTDREEGMENTIDEKRQLVNQKIHYICELEQGLSDVQMKLVNKDLVIANLRNGYLTLSKAKITAYDNVTTLESELRKSNSELEFMRIKLQDVVVDSEHLQAELGSTRIELASAGEELKRG